jgi:drug/metabolite transporter (DMT)-like permease
LSSKSFYNISRHSGVVPDPFALFSLFRGDSTLIMTNSLPRTYDRRGLALSALGGMLFTLDIPLLRLAAGDYWTMIFARGLCMGLAIAAGWYLYRRTTGSRIPFINGWPGLAVVATNSLANILFIAAVTKTTAANLVFILALNPVFCTIIGAIFLREVLPRTVWLSIALSMVGVAVIGWDGVSTGTYVGDLLALGVALCTSIGLTIVRKSGRNVISSLALGSLVSAAIAYLLIGGNASALSMEGWSWIGLNGLLVVPLASALIALGPRYIPAAEVAMFFLLDTVLTPLWIWLIFGELPTERAFIGGAVILASLAMLGTWRIRSSKMDASQVLMPVHQVQEGR